MNNNPPFAIGQKVVALANHSHGAYFKGDIFKILAINSGCCNWMVDIGKSQPSATTGFTRCMDCGVRTKGYWFLASNFAPIITNYSDATAEILEKFKQTTEVPDKILIPETA